MKFTRKSFCLYDEADHSILEINFCYLYGNFDCHLLYLVFLLAGTKSGSDPGGQIHFA